MNNRYFIRKYNLTYDYITKIYLDIQMLKSPERKMMQQNNNVLLTMKYKVGLKCFSLLRLSNQIFFFLSFLLSPCCTHFSASPTSVREESCHCSQSDDSSLNARTQSSSALNCLIEEGHIEMGQVVLQASLRQETS